MMITSHPAIHTCQNYDYFSRTSGGLPVIIAVSGRFGDWIAQEGDLRATQCPSSRCARRDIAE
ncbi:hypothetical protein [Cognatishimia sp. F0-27]|uniref:hypothetical protein n=1 Tax=Cognatishimia sp. F0-27 TaxID=2816855 RepID=UPI001D0CDC99|nr:hypothetical protein [Cognatishimia sp. F0-27]MCC1493549.1 hypothetical protein [Cognatishimia sp. F0-27]